MRNAAILFALLVIIAATVFLVQFAIPAQQPAHDLPTNLRDTQPNVVLEAKATAEKPLKSRLPARSPFQVRDPRLKPLVDSSLPAENRISPGITAMIPSVTDPGDQQALADVLTDSADDDTVRNEIANLLRRSKYPGLTHALLQVLENPDEKPRFRSFAVQHLWQQLDGAGREDQDRIRAKMHELIADRHVEVRREALLSLVRMRDPIGKTTAIGWLTSLEPSTETTRDLAIRCVYDLGLREQMPVIRPFTRNPNEVTQIAAIVVLSQWGDEASREAFTAAANSSSIRLQRAGKAALERLDQKASHPPMASTDGAPKVLPGEDAK